MSRLESTPQALTSAYKSQNFVLIFVTFVVVVVVVVVVGGYSEELVCVEWTFNDF